MAAMTVTYLKFTLDAEAGEVIHFRLAEDQAMMVSKRISTLESKEGFPMVTYQLGFGPGATPDEQEDSRAKFEASDGAQFRHHLQRVKEAVDRAIHNATAAAGKG